MTTRFETEVTNGSVEPLLEELLTEIVTGTRLESKGHNGNSFTAALTEAAMASFSRTVTQASMVERALLVEALAPALAEALAPALAKALAPEIVTALSHLATAPEPAVESEYEEPGYGQADYEESDYEESDYQEPGYEEAAGEEPHTADAGSGQGREVRE